MKKECEIVQDLIFGYCDGTLNPASKELVEKHLVKCEECKKVYEEIKKDKQIEGDDKIEIDYLKRVNKKLKRKKTIIIISSVLIILLVILHIIAFISYYHDQTTMEIFMNKEISEEQMTNIQNQIKNQAEDVEITYVSAKQHLENLKEKFKENQDLLAGYNDENNIFTDSFVIKTKLAQDIEKIEKSLVNVEGIQKIQSSSINNPYMALANDFMTWYIDMHGPVSNGE